MGERTPLALIDAPASGRMAVGEAITNIAAADVGAISRREAVRELDGACRTSWRRCGAVRHGACGRLETCVDARRVDPRRQGFDVDAHDVERGRRRARGDGAGIAHRLRVCARSRRAQDAHAAACATRIPSSCLLDVADGRRRLGGSALAQVYGQLGNEAPDLDDPARLAAFFALVAAASRQAPRLSRRGRRRSRGRAARDGVLLASRDRHLDRWRSVADAVRRGDRRRRAGASRRRRWPDPRCARRRSRCASRRRACDQRPRPHPCGRSCPVRRVAHRPSSRMVDDHARDAAPARQSRCSGPGIRPHRRRRRSRHAAAAVVRCGR